MLVILVSFFQPQSQSYSGATFPAVHGQATSFFQSSGVQQEFAFIPDDGSATYVINVENNSTTSYAGPTSKDADSSYAASITALVQLDSTGNLYFFPYTEGDTSANSAASWTKVTAVSKVAPASSASASATGSHSGSSSASATGSSGSASSASDHGPSSKSSTSCFRCAPSCRPAPTFLPFSRDLQNRCEVSYFSSRLRLN